MVIGGKSAKSFKWLGAHDSRSVGEDVGGDTGNAEPASLLVGGLVPAGISARFQRLTQNDGVETDLLRQPGQNLGVADILRMSEVRGEYGPMELGVLAGIASELSGLDRKPRIRQEFWRLEGKIELGATATHAFLPLCSAGAK